MTRLQPREGLLMRSGERGRGVDWLLAASRTICDEHRLGDAGCSVLGARITVVTMNVEQDRDGRRKHPESHAHPAIIAAEQSRSKGDSHCATICKARCCNGPALRKSAPTFAIGSSYVRANGRRTHRPHW